MGVVFSVLIRATLLCNGQNVTQQQNKSEGCKMSNKSVKTLNAEINPTKVTICYNETGEIIIKINTRCNP